MGSRASRGSRAGEHSGRGGSARLTGWAGRFKLRGGMIELSRKTFCRSGVRGFHSGRSLSFLIVFCFCWVTSNAESPPNIVFILADDLDFDEIGVYSHREFPSRTGAQELGFTEWEEDWRAYADPRMHTPHIDSLAERGARFDRFYVTTAICSPSRYSFLTGRYASRSGPFLDRKPPGTEALIDWSTSLGPEEPNLPKELKALGYATGMVGKWHLGFPAERIDPVGPAANPEDPAVAEQILANYERSVRYVREHFGFDWVGRLYVWNKEAVRLGIPDSLRHHNLEWITEGALEFIETYAEGGEPFFLYFSLTIPHSQYDGRYGEYRGADPLATSKGLLEERPRGQPSRASIDARLAERGIDSRNAMATWMDDSVGAVLELLRELGIEDNTIVIFTSDHQNRGKFTVMEGSRVPFLIRWPDGIRAGMEIEALSANIDLLPTLVEWAGGEVPGDLEVDGRSLTPLFEAVAPDNWRKALLLECNYSRAVVGDTWKYVAHRPPETVRKRMDEDWRRYARTGERRTVHWTGRSNPHRSWGEAGIRYVADLDFPHFFDYDQLYDLEADPFEQVNVADYPHYRPELDAQKEELRELLEGLPHAFGEFSEGEH